MGPPETPRDLESSVMVSLERLKSKAGITPGQQRAQRIHCLLVSAQTPAFAPCTLAQSVSTSKGLTQPGKSLLT